MNELLV